MRADVLLLPAASAAPTAEEAYTFGALWGRVLRPTRRHFKRVVLAMESSSAAASDGSGGGGGGVARELFHALTAGVKSTTSKQVCVWRGLRGGDFTTKSRIGILAGWLCSSLFYLFSYLFLQYCSAITHTYRNHISVINHVTQYALTRGVFEPYPRVTSIHPSCPLVPAPSRRRRLRRASRR